MGVLPRIKTCRVVGIFDTGMFEYDSTLVYVSLETARILNGMEEGVHGLEVRVDNV